MVYNQSTPKVVKNICMLKIRIAFTYISKLLNVNITTNNNKYETIVEHKFIENILLANLLNSTLSSRSLAPSRTAYLLIPKPANKIK